MASWHEAWPTTSTSTGTPAAVRAVPHRVAGALLAVGPDPLPAVVVVVPPQPATAPAASSASAPAATARERPRMGASFPRESSCPVPGGDGITTPRLVKPATPAMITLHI